MLLQDKKDMMYSWNYVKGREKSAYNRGYLAGIKKGKKEVSNERRTKKGI